MAQCVILAAGEGKRMRPLTGSRPKVMLPVANRPMLEHLITAVRNAGIKEFILVVGYGERSVREYFGDGSKLGVSVRYVTQKHQRGTADAVWVTRSHISETFLLMNGDMLIAESDVAAIMNRTSPCIGVFSSEHPEDYGVVTVSDGTVISLEEKSSAPKGNLINAGIYLFSPDIFQKISEITPSPRGELELTDAVIPYIRAGSLNALKLSQWCDIGNPWNLLDANENLLKNHKPESEGEIEDNVVLKGDVSVGRGTVIKAGTYIEGPCIIGKGCRIGPHTYIRGATSIGDNCHIGHSTEIKNSVIMSDTNIPHFNYVGDSVIGSHCNFGAGTKIANLRHDKKNIRVAGSDTRRKKFGAIIGDNVLFGINCSVNVGTVIGNKCAVVPHTYVDGHIGDGTTIRR